MNPTKINKNLRYLIIPDFVYQDTNLTRLSQNIYCFIHTFKGEYFYFSNPHLAEMFQVNEDSISRAISQLIELKYIHAEYEQKAGGGKTRFIKDLWFEQLNGWVPLDTKPKSKLTQSPSGNEATDSTQSPSGNEAKLASRNDNINDNNIKGNLENVLKQRKQKHSLKRSFGFSAQVPKKYPEKKKLVYIDGTGII